MYVCIIANMGGFFDFSAGFKRENIKISYKYDICE